MNRAETAGLGLSLAGHVALIALLSLGLFTLAQPPVVPPPAIDVDIVADDVALQSATPQPAPAPPAPRVAREIGPPEEAAPPEPAQPVPQPKPTPPAPTPRPQPAPRPKPAPMAKPAPAKPAPARPAPSLARPAPARPAPSVTSPPRRPGLDRSLVAGLRDVPGAPTARPAAKPSATPTAAPSAPVGPAQLAGLAAAIARQVQPCANRIVKPGPGAERIKTKIYLQLNSDGSFAAPPRIVGQSTDDDNARYGTQVGERARAAFIQCAPFDLPAALYEKGWKTITLNYKLPE